MTSRFASRTADTRSSRPEGGPGRRRGIRLFLVVAGLAIVGVAAGAYAWNRRGPDPDQLWMSAQAALKADRIDEAEDAARRLAGLRPVNSLDWMLQAQVDMARGRTDQALEKLAEIPDGDRMAPQARLMSGQLELRRQRVRFAEKYFRQAVALDPGLVKAHNELIYIFGYQLRRTELSAEFLALSKITELTHENVFHWCLMRTATWEPGPVIQDLTKFIEADPEDHWSRLAIAENYRRMGLSAEALAAISSLPDTDPDALALRVMLAIDRHQDDEAERMLESGPADYPPLARIRGRLALARRDAKAAVRNFRIAQADDPLNRDTVLGLANALTLLGDPAAAAARDTAKKLEFLNTLIQRAASVHERDNPELILALGAACADLGQYPEAAAWYKLAIARNPLDTQAQQALFRVSSRARQDQRESSLP
jgi:tetratricopeptide (TPR) repeat protein